MAYLISNLKGLNERLGGNIYKMFLAPNLFLDAPLMVIPYILKHFDKHYLLYRNQEHGNCDFISTGNLIKKSYNSYFLVDKKIDNKAKKNIIELLKELLAEENKLHIDDNLPYAVYNTIKRLGLF